MAEGDLLATSYGTGARRRVQWNLLRQMVDEVVSGAFPEGETLPNEAELAEQFKVSRTTLREVMQHMGAQGLIRSRTRAGTVVLPRGHWNHLDPLVLDAALRHTTDERFYLSLVDARHLLEPAAAADAAARAGEEEVAAITAAFQAMVEAKARDNDAWAAADLKFHTSIIDASGNWVYRQFIIAIRAALLASFRLTNRRSQSHDEAIRMHGDVLDAIRTHRPTAARSSMERLIDFARSEISEALRRERQKTAPDT